MKRNGYLSRIGDVALTTALFAGLALIITWLNSKSKDEYSGHPFVIDGDTILIGEEKFRLNGIDAPELDQTCHVNNLQTRCGLQSKAHLESIIGDNSIRCVTSTRDRYNRLLSQCYQGKLNINRDMVKNGWAISWKDDYREDEAIAKRQAKGLWQGEFSRPSDWRKENMDQSGDAPAAWWKIWN